MISLNVGTELQIQNQASADQWDDYGQGIFLHGKMGKIKILFIWKPLAEIKPHLHLLVTIFYKTYQFLLENHLWSL